MRLYGLRIPYPQTLLSLGPTCNRLRSEGRAYHTNANYSIGQTWAGVRYQQYPITHRTEFLSKEVFIADI